MKTDFPEMRSEAYNSRYILWLKRFIVFLVIAIITAFLLFLCLAMLTDFIAYGKDSYRILYATFFIILAALCGALIYDRIRLKNRIISYFIVNDQGILYFSKNGQLVKETLYKDLAKSPDYYSKDIFSTSAGTGKYSSFRMNLVVYKKNKDNSVNKIYVDLNSIALKNKYHLIGHFLKGIRLFRPELSIAPHVYKDFYLNEKTLDFAPEIRRKDFGIKALIWCIIAMLFIILFLYVR
ncbi:hypothetical protein [Elizabethkingia meningoseptica]|uniref:hypothetical protein n=1 Tax=Elizabethkingia meningoseptica TaxID=238 RepID=UPI003892BADD